MMDTWTALEICLRFLVLAYTDNGGCPKYLSTSLPIRFESVTLIFLFLKCATREEKPPFPKRNLENQKEKLSLVRQELKLFSVT